MKRFSILLLMAVWLSGGILARAQDAATEERLNKLSGQVEDLLAAKAEQDKRISALIRELESVREAANKPTGNYANAEDVRRLADTVKDVDRRRIDDNEKIMKSIDQIAKAAASSAHSGERVRPTTTTQKPSNTNTSSSNDKGYEYTIAPGDTLSTIVEAYRAQGVKVTLDQVYKANPGLKEKSLKVGQKVFIPMP